MTEEETNASELTEIIKDLERVKDNVTEYGYSPTLEQIIERLTNMRNQLAE